MKLLIKNATVLNEELSGNQDIGVENGIIDFIGKKPDSFVADETIDAKNGIAMPGLVNAHTHSPMTLLRNLADDCAFSEWLFNKVIPFENKLTEEDIYWGAELAVAEMLRSGTTAFADMYFHMDQIAEVVAKSGIRANLSYGPICSSTRGGRQIIDEKSCADFINKWNNYDSGRIKAYVEIHSVYLFDLEAINAAAALAKKLETGIHIHVSESLSEQQTMKEKYGKTPVEICLSSGIFDVPVLAAHCVQVNDSDISILSSKNVNVVHNPTSNLKLACGTAPVMKFFKAGVNAALGTDGCCSNNNLNMFEEMHITAILHKGINADAECVTADDVIKMATVNGARALGFENLGQLKPGYKADIVILDRDSPHLCPLGNISSALAYSAQASDVRDVIVAGKVLMKDKVLKTIDIEQAVFRARKLRGEE